MATDQIRQMVNFILQEAHEKANEIRVKVCWLEVGGSVMCTRALAERLGWVGVVTALMSGFNGLCYLLLLHNIRWRSQMIC